MFGKLLVISADGFLEAIESEERGTYVVIHLTDPVCLFGNVIQLMPKLLMAL